MKRVRAITACVALAFLLAACGDSDETANGNGGQETGGQSGSGGGESGGASGEQYARGQYALTEDGAADGQYEDTAPGDLPFPAPPDADIVAAGQSPDRAYGAFMNVPSGREAYEFYRQSLPDAGFEISRDKNTAQNNEGTNGDGGGESEQPFAAVLVVEGNDLRGRFRFDEERVVVGMSEAAVRAAAEAEAEREEQRQAREEEATGREAPAEGEEGQ